MVAQRLDSPVEVTDPETGTPQQPQVSGQAATNGKKAVSASAGDFTITRTLEEMLGDI